MGKMHGRGVLPVRGAEGGSQGRGLRIAARLKEHHVGIMLRRDVMREDENVIDDLLRAFRCCKDSTRHAPAVEHGDVVREGEELGREGPGDDVVVRH